MNSNRHQSPAALPAFNPLANSNESDRSSSSNTTVTANAFSSPKRREVAQYHAVNNVNALSMFNGDSLPITTPQCADKARLDASCCVYNGSSTQNHSVSSMSMRSTPPQFLDEYAGATASGSAQNGHPALSGTASLHAVNMSTLPSLVDGRRTETASAPHVLPSSYRLINAFQDLAPYHDHGPLGGDMECNVGMNSMRSALGAVSQLSAVEELNLSQCIPPSVGRLDSAPRALSRAHSMAQGQGQNGLFPSNRNQSALPSTACSLNAVRSVQSVGVNVHGLHQMDTLNVNGFNGLQGAIHGVNASAANHSRTVAALCDQLQIPPIPNLSVSALHGAVHAVNPQNGSNGINAMNGIHGINGLNPLTLSAPRSSSAVVLTAPPLPATAIPDALKRSPSPHGVGGISMAMRSKGDGHGNGHSNGAMATLNGKSGRKSKGRTDGVGTMQKFECAECGKRYKHLSNLRAHAKVHTAEAKVCPFCKKRFGRKANYEEHLRVHTGETPYECKYCQRKFKHRHSWKDHLRIHTGEKPFECHVCNRTFNVRHNLTVHYRVHTGERPYSCSICLKTFRQKSAVNSHVKRIHK